MNRSEDCAQSIDWTASRLASMASYVDVVLPHAAPTLISPEARRRIRAVAGQLPPCALAGFECRLDERSDQVDLQVDVARVAWSPPGAAAAPAWPAVARLCAAWAEAAVEPHRSIDSIALEFDAPVASPSVFARLGAGADVLAVAEALAAAPLPPSRAAALRALVAALPAGARVLYLGLMWSRPEAGLRVNVRGLAPEHLPALLQHIGWPGALDDAVACMRWLAARCDFIVVCLDLADRVLPRLGFECFSVPPRSHAPMLELLVERGLCSPRRRDDLLAWCGRTARRAGAPWPANLVACDALMGAHLDSVFERQISHVKVSHAPGRGLEAKGYLVFSHGWRPRRSDG